MSNSLINLGELSKPAVVLIEKISEGVGGIFKPYQLKRVAEAEAEAEKIKARAQIEITDLHERAIHRWIEEEAKRQENMEDITAKALPQVNEKANPDAMDDDWITNFFDKCRIISDSEMQILWSQVLAGEANVPGTYSKRTVNLLSELDKSDAELFTQLCRFGWMIRDVVPLVFDIQAEIYNRYGINFNTMSHLDSIGLVQFQGLTGISELNLPKRFTVHYYGKPLHLEMTEETDNKLRIGNTLLTKNGQELAPICGSKPVDGFYEYVKEQWKAYLPQPENIEQN